MLFVPSFLLWALASAHDPACSFRGYRRPPGSPWRELHLGQAELAFLVSPPALQSLPRQAPSFSTVIWARRLLFAPLPYFSSLGGLSFSQIAEILEGSRRKPNLPSCRESRAKLAGGLAGRADKNAASLGQRAGSYVTSGREGAGREQPLL